MHEHEADKRVRLHARTHRRGFETPQETPICSLDAQGKEPSRATPRLLRDESFKTLTKHKPFDANSFPFKPKPISGFQISDSFSRVLKMYRSGSLSRSLDGFTASPPPIKKTTSAATFDLLPRYTQLTVEDPKKQSKFKAEHSVHFIPLVLILCALVLWFSGGAPHGDFSLAKHDETMMSKIKSSDIGDGLEETKPLIAGSSVNLKQLKNVSVIRERIQDSH